MIRQYIIAAALISVSSLSGCYETSQPVGETMDSGVMYNDFYRTNRITGTIKHCKHITWMHSKPNADTGADGGTTDYSSVCRTIRGDGVLRNMGGFNK